MPQQNTVPPCQFKQPSLPAKYASLDPENIIEMITPQEIIDIFGKTIGDSLLAISDHNKKLSTSGEETLMLLLFMMSVISLQEEHIHELFTKKMLV
jgi:hypothetical protein